MSVEKLLAFVKSDVGLTRKNNEDYVSFIIPFEKDKLEKYGSIFVVADGVGCSAFGEIASTLAVQTIINSYYSLPYEITVQDRLKKTFDMANIELIKRAGELKTREISSTAVCSVIIKDNAYIANVGDSRAYLINQGRKSKIDQITSDHSLVAEQVRIGLLTEGEAKKAPNINMITRAVGAESQVEIDLFEVNLINGDKLLLCSDGLVRVVDNNEIFTITESNPIENAIPELISLANSRGGPDNITICLVSFEKT